jgi:hypothetical protein
VHTGGSIWTNTKLKLNTRDEAHPLRHWVVSPERAATRPSIRNRLLFRLTWGHMKNFFFAVTAAIACTGPTFAQSSSDGFTVAFSLGSSPIAEAFSVGAGLTYNATLSENISLEAAAKVSYNSLSQTFGMGINATPQYKLGLLSGENYNLSAYAALEAAVMVLPTPVGLFLTPKAGVNLTYDLDDVFSVLTGLELSASVNFDGQPVSFAPFLGALVQGDVFLSEQLQISLGSYFGTDFAAVYFNPFLNIGYAITPTMGIGIGAGYDDGVFLTDTAGWYIKLGGKIRL